MAARKIAEPIAFVDLQAQRKRIGARTDQAIGRVFAHGQFVLGPEVGMLEKRLAAHCGARHATGCANGTDANVLALMALDVQHGNAVFCPSFTFAATAEAVAPVGAAPVFGRDSPRKACGTRQRDLTATDRRRSQRARASRRGSDPGVLSGRDVGLGSIQIEVDKRTRSRPDCGSSAFRPQSSIPSRRTDGPPTARSRGCRTACPSRRRWRATCSACRCTPP